MTNKGSLTKQRLLELSKECFYKYGYKKTTIEKISSIAGISAGNFTYHFKSKEILVKEIFNDYCRQVSDYVLNNMVFDDEDTQTEQEYVYKGMIFFNNILKDEQSTRFLKEVLLQCSLVDLIKPMMTPLYEKLDKKYNLRFNSPIIYHFRTRAEQGALSGVLLSYIDDRKNMPTLDFSMLATHFSAVAIGIPETLYYSLGIQCFKTLRNADFEDIKLL